MQLDEQRLRFRDAMASLSAAVNIITTEGDAGKSGISLGQQCRLFFHKLRFGQSG